MKYGIRAKKARKSERNRKKLDEDAMLWSDKQLSVVKRFKHLISDHTKRRLYNAFILPVFNYCSDVWDFC